MWNIGPTQLLIVLIIILVLFGGKKLPDLARSLGRSLGEFKKGKEEGEKLSKDKVKDLVDELKAEDAANLPGAATAAGAPEELKAGKPADSEAAPKA